MMQAIEEALDAGQFPALARPIEWGPVRARFVPEDRFDERWVSNVTIIPCVGERYVIFRLEDGRWELPGGTLEPGERYMDGLKREVMEELGGELLSYELFGQFRCRSSAASPYRPHIPHPFFIRLVGYGQVRLVGQPLNPPDGEQVAAVETVSVEEAANRFLSQGRQDIADLYRLAHVVRTCKEQGKAGAAE